MVTENQMFNLEERLLLSAKEREDRINDMRQQYDEELKRLENNLIVVKEELKQSKARTENHKVKLAEQNAEVLILRHKNQQHEEETTELEEKLLAMSHEYTKRLEKYILDLKDYFWVDDGEENDLKQNGNSNLELRRHIEEMLEGFKKGCETENKILTNKIQKIRLQAEDIVRRHEKLLTAYKLQLRKADTQEEVKDLEMLDVSLPPDSDIKAAQVKERNELQMRVYVAEQTIKDLQDKVDTLKSELMKSKNRANDNAGISDHSGNLDWSSVRKQMREFTLNVQFSEKRCELRGQTGQISEDEQDLEKERAELITRCQLSEQQLAECHDYIETYMKRYQQEIIHLRKLLAQCGRTQSADGPLALEHEPRAILPPLQNRTQHGRIQRR